MTVRELLARMDSKEFAEWMAYYNLEPFGEERADARAAIGAYTTYSVNAGKTRKLKPEDFLVVKPTKPVQSVADQILMAQHTTSVLGVLDK